MSSLIRSYVSGLAQILITGEIAEPTTEPRPVVNRITWEPQAISSAISALSLMLGNPKRGSPSGTTSKRYNPPLGGTSPGLIRPEIGASPLLQYAPIDFSSIVVSPPSAFPGAKLAWPICL